MAVLIKPFLDFPTKKFSPGARKIWKEFFDLSTAKTDAAYWVIDANSASIKVYVRYSGEDVLGNDWSGNMPIITAANGVIERFEAASANPQSIHREFRTWAEQGILDAFNQKQVSGWYQASPIAQKPFAIVSTSTDEGIELDNLKLLWQRDDSFGVDEIKKNHELSNRTRPGKRLKKRKK